MRFNPDDYRGAKACVLGCGVSGAACARLLAAKGFRVFISDSRQKENAGSPVDAGMHVEIEWGGHTDRVLECAFAVKSPGIMPSAPVLEKLAKKGIPVFSEVETALAFVGDCTVLAITGTSGKTTTASLAGEVLKRQYGDRKIHVCGNIGTPVSQIVHDVHAGDIIVLEMSSYQLADSRFFKPRAACVLNITPDHIGHHGNMEEYVAAKKKIFALQDETALCVFNADDPTCADMTKDCRARKQYFSAEKTDGANAFLRGGEIVFQTEAGTFSMHPPLLPGAHNITNAMAAGLLALFAGAKKEALSAAFTSFRAMEHRLENLGKVNGVLCVNDSKASNVNSTAVALETLGSGRKNIWLIMGGEDKGAPYRPLVRLISENVKTVMAIGQASGRLARELEGAAPVRDCDVLENAVAECFRSAEKGDVILFSPACASFDQFEGYQDRGRKFKELVAAQKS